MRYSQFAIERFWKILTAYKKALREGNKMDIINMSLAIHSALGDVPKYYKRYVNSAFNNCGKEE